MNNRIFREYDIRGIVDEDFPDEVVINLGRAYGKILSDNNQKNISISGDIRHSTNRLKNNLIEGLTNSGINVYDLGILPTPVNYFSLFHTDIKNSIQITGSHNPKEYNGFKISFNGKPFFGQDIKKIQSIKKKINQFKKNGVKLIKLNNKSNGFFDLKLILNKIYLLGCRSLLVEGGKTLTKNFLKDNLFNQFFLFQSDNNLGKNAKLNVASQLRQLSFKYKTKCKLNSYTGNDIIYLYS